MIKCAKDGCKNYAHLKADSELYCSEHRKIPGCLTALFIVCFIGFLSVVVNIVLGHTIPVQSPDKQRLCWMVDIAWYWEDQPSDLYNCTPITAYSHQELFNRGERPTP